MIGDRGEEVRVLVMNDYSQKKEAVVAKCADVVKVN
jgi:hypothetical protein